MFEKRRGLLSNQAWSPSSQTLQCNEKVDTQRRHRCWGGGLVEQVLATWAGGPGFHLQHHIKPVVVEHICNPSLREGREVHIQRSWGLLDRPSRQNAEAPGSMRDLVSKNKVESDWGRPLMLTMNTRDHEHMWLSIHHLPPLPHPQFHYAVEQSRYTEKESKCL